MSAAPLPSDEDARISALLRAALLDTPPEPFFDAIVHEVAKDLDTPIALVSLVDETRQWFKAKHGLDVAETEKEYAFCAYAILRNTPLVVTDARHDERFFDNPLVTDEPHVIAYAGAPIMLKCGARIGTVCAIDNKPRQWRREDVQKLIEAADITARHIEERREELKKTPQRYMEIVMFGTSIDDEAA